MNFAFIFPGQGSQSVGMMKGFDESRQIHDTFVEASDVLKQDLWGLVNEGSSEELGQTVNTQPLMLTAGISIYRAWQALGGATPSTMAGHS
ncbi:MAG: acyltransferase domain-containing protein, partial [Sulfuricellaceae bacterium]|nr:acyltransferase domain-containing protein [Sulfuricellaceae bacterium]